MTLRANFVHALAILLAGVVLAGCEVGRLRLGARATEGDAAPTGEAALMATAESLATATAQPEAQQTAPPLLLPPTPTATAVPTVVGGSNLQAALVGEWRGRSANLNIQDLWIFHPDGRFAFTANNAIVQGGRYKVGDDNHVEIEFAKGIAKTFAAFFVDGRLILEDRDKTNRIELERQQ